MFRFPEKAAVLLFAVAAYLVPPAGQAAEGDALTASTIPVHLLVLVALGMPILDNMDLEAVSRATAEHGRWEFLWTASPLRVRTGTGSPLNPIATF